MIYLVRHKTTYSYEAPVEFARCVLRLTPQSSATQTVLHHAVTLRPAPHQSVERCGAFGEHALTVIIDKPHRVLVVEARSRVEVHAATMSALMASSPWEQVRELSCSHNELGPTGPASYLYPTSRAPLAGEITDYARKSFSPGVPIIHAASDLMRRIKADFTFDPKATDITTPPQVAFKARRGVCQDFAHIMISGLRGLGLPAAYVSGYLRTIPPAGQARLEGADATHAWVSVWCGEGIGWVGFDPTNAILVENDHIILAVGRDYADVPPIEGVLLSNGQQDLKVEVDVIPEEDVGVARMDSRTG